MPYCDHCGDRRLTKNTVTISAGTFCSDKDCAVEQLDRASNVPCPKCFQFHHSEAACLSKSKRPKKKM